MLNILVCWRISLQMIFTIFYNGMLIIYYVGSDVLLDPAVTVQDKKNFF
jgi:hypothetical protein